MSATSSHYAFQSKGYIKKVHNFDAAWRRVVQRFGLGNRLILVITDAPPKTMADHLRRYSDNDNLYDAPLPSGARALFYLDNICHSNGVQTLIVTKDNVNGKKVIVPCKPLDVKTNLYDYFTKAVMRFHTHAHDKSYMYIISPYTGREYLVSPKNAGLPRDQLRIDIVANCTELMKNAPAAALKEHAATVGEEPWMPRFVADKQQQQQQKGSGGCSSGGGCPQTKEKTLAMPTIIEYGIPVALFLAMAMLLLFYVFKKDKINK